MYNFLPNTLRYGRIDLRGPDAADFGHRMFSRNLKSLDFEDPTLTLLLSPEGRIQSVFWLIKQPDLLILLAQMNLVQSTMAAIEHFHFSENFETVLGPDPSISWSPATPQSKIVWRKTEFRFHLDEKTPQFGDDLEWEEHRIRNLIPIFPNDFDQQTLVFDMGFEELCDEGKGCYVGQEIVERVRSRAGHGPKRLSLISSKEKCRPGQKLFDEGGAEIGQLSSAFWADGESLGLVSLPAKKIPVGFEIKAQM